MPWKITYTYYNAEEPNYAEPAHAESRIGKVWRYKSNCQTACDKINRERRAIRQSSPRIVINPAGRFDSMPELVSALIRARRTYKCGCGHKFLKEYKKYETLPEHEIADRRRDLFFSAHPCPSCGASVEPVKKHPLRGTPFIPVTNQ